MATKKDRKVVRREGMGPVGTDSHKSTELESCQRLLEFGAIGARSYEGPNVVGQYLTRQDRLLNEIKWVAVDVYEQRKLAIAHCRLVSSMVQKHWAEKSRGTLSGAASMVQAYWMSVAREIRAPLTDESKGSAVFKLNTLRPAGSPRQTVAGPTSLLPTPTAGLTPTGMMTPSPEEASMVGPDKRSLAHGLVHNWLSERAEENPPSAEGTTGLADFSVQIVKHHLREDHSHVMQSHQSPSSATESPSKSEESVSTAHLDNDFMIPVEPFVAPDDSLGSEETYRSAVHAALEWAVQQNLGKRGVDGVRCLDLCDDLYSHVLVSPAALENHRTIFHEIVATNVMARTPHLFSLCSSATLAEPRKTQVLDRRPRESEPPANNVPTPPKHYFVSVIYSSFTPVAWSAVEDSILREAVWESEMDWDLVATTVNWRMQTWTGRENLRSAQQCRDRFKELPTADAVPTDTSRRKKIASTGSQSSGFFPVEINRFKQYGKWKVSAKHNVGRTTVEELEVENPFVLCKTAGGPCPPAAANSFERRGVFALAKPPTNYFAKAFFHFPKDGKLIVLARGATAVDRENISYAYEAAPMEGPISLAPVVAAEPPHPSILVENAREEMINFIVESASRVLSEKARAEPPKKAFSVEDLLKKNSSAVPGNVPLYISGQMVCPPHPSFANMIRIAEMTLTRLISSVVENGQQAQQPPPPVPMPITNLFQYCALFRKKYPAVFTSQHKINKPSMPPPRTQANGVNRVLTRPQQVQPKAAPAAPVQNVSAAPSLPSAPASVPLTPTEHVSAPQSLGASASAGMVRTSQRQKRAPNAAGRTPPSPNVDTPKTPNQQPADNSFMVAGGPSLYGQFNHRTRQGR